MYSTHQASEVNKSMQNETNYYLNPLFQWMCSFSTNTQVIKSMLSLFCRYRVGVTPDEKVIYWQHDIEGKCRAGKVMKYDHRGHRDKQYGAQWMHTLNHLDDFNLSQVPFGLHLLAKHPFDTSVVVVESEKTALLAAAYHVECLNGDSRLPLFIATGGAGNLKNTLQYLKGRKVIIMPDEDQSVEWAKIASQHRSSMRSVTIDTTVRQYVIDGILPPKSDYGDLLTLVYKGEKP